MSEPLALTIPLADEEALTAQKPHVAHGGLFVPTPEPCPPALSPVAVTLAGPTRQVGPLAARVVQVTEAGLALAFDDPAALGKALDKLLRSAAAPEEPEGTLFDRVRAMKKAEKRQLALHGDRAARLILMKDVDKELHASVIQNPAITLDEIRYIAGYRQTNPDVLKRIAANRDWVQYPQVVSALVRNPKTPTPVALRLVDRLSLTEQRTILRSQQASMAVLQAIKRKLAG